MMHRSCCRLPAARNCLSTPPELPTRWVPMHQGQVAGSQGGRRRPGVGGAPRRAQRHHKGTPLSSRKRTPRRKCPDRRVTSRSTQNPRAGWAHDDFLCGNPTSPVQWWASLLRGAGPLPASNPSWDIRGVMGKMCSFFCWRSDTLAASSLPILCLWWCELLMAHAVWVCDKTVHKYSFGARYGVFPPSVA